MVDDDLLVKISGGVTPAMATPLTEAGYEVNVGALSALIDFLIAAGVKGLFVGGTTGEGILLSSQQRRVLHEHAMRAVARRVPVLLHVGANTVAESVALAQHAAGLSPDAIVAVTPTFYPMPDDALLAYFATVAAAAPETPFLAYDIPHMAVNGVSPRLLARLIAEVPSMVGLKCSRPDAQAIRELIDTLPPGAALLAGNERIALGSLALGAAGLISGLATAIPEPFVTLTAAFQRGDIAAARAAQQKVNRLLNRLPPGQRIGAVKAILAERGIAAGPAVPPRPTPDGKQLWADLEPLL